MKINASQLPIADYELHTLRENTLTMAIPIELSFRNLEHSDFVENKVRKRCVKLEAICNEITYCHVVLSSPHKHQHKGNHYEVHLEVRVPGAEIAVTRNTGASSAHEDLYVAIRDAFTAIERKITRWKEKRRLDVKEHSRPEKPPIPE